jgi:branched-chain amino acid transport system substrate-binding protein
VFAKARLSFEWIYAIFAVYLLLCCYGCGVRHDVPSEANRGFPSKPFVVAVVGDGVPSPEPANRDHPLNNAQGRAMWVGANAAFQSSPECERLRSFAEMRPKDDGGSAALASNIALQLRSDPRTIAVIGHATSGTTRAAAWAYAEAHLPLLMPIATSPNANHPPVSRNYLSSPLPNCFRLPPSDDRFQVAAIRYLLRKRLNSRRVYLLRDISEDSGEYSGPLFTRLESLLNPLIVSKRRVDRDSSNMFLIAESIKGYRTDTVVFCGYGTTAQELLHAMRSAYASKDPHVARPRIILTDGCKTDEVDPSGFETYVTFPLPEIQANTPTTNAPELQILRTAIAATAKQSYEIYGYDAMLLLGRAFSRCGSTQSVRDCLVRQLKSSQDSSGVLFSYGFDEYGENQQAPYHVYSSLHANFPSNTFHYQFSIPPSSMRDELKPENVK